jgi:ABC-type multidrug transport system fused ATPase/permease subunit
MMLSCVKLKNTASSSYTFYGFCMGILFNVCRACDAFDSDVHESFNYDSDVHDFLQILNGLSLTIKNGQTVALVGGSGCGKSTVIQLLQRFYDPLDGAVFIDGNDIKELNIKWLRQHIGVVSQEPVLFAMSIADNIRFGRDGVSQAEIEKAARQANAHSFISELPLVSSG